MKIITNYDYENKDSNMPYFLTDPIIHYDYSIIQKAINKIIFDENDQLESPMESYFPPSLKPKAEANFINTNINYESHEKITLNRDNGSSIKYVNNEQEINQIIDVKINDFKKSLKFQEYDNSIQNNEKIIKEKMEKLKIEEESLDLLSRIQNLEEKNLFLYDTLSNLPPSHFKLHDTDNEENKSVLEVVL